MTIYFTKLDRPIELDPAVQKLASAVGLMFNPACDVAIFRLGNLDRLLGGVMFNNYTGSSIEVHVAGFVPGWLNRDMLWAAFDYPFNQLGVKAVFARMREDNTHAIAFNANLGFKEVSRIDDVFPEGQCVVTKITRDQCRWLNLQPRSLRRKVEDGREEQGSQAA